MRCPEVVLALITNCVRVDPQSAIVYKAVNDTRRIIYKDDSRYARFYKSLHAALHEDHDNIQGPASHINSRHTDKMVLMMPTAVMAAMRRHQNLR